MAKEQPTAATMTGHDEMNDIGLHRLRERTVIETAFAGRIGGNQEFTASAHDQEILQRQPDAVCSVGMKLAL